MTSAPYIYYFLDVGGILLGVALLLIVHPSHKEHHDGFYKHLKRKDGVSSCCSNKDCREAQLSRLRYVKDALYDPKILSPDKRRDLAHILGVVLDNVEDQILPDKYQEE